MPIIEHSAVGMPEVAEYRRERFLVSKREGATSLTIKEVELYPGYEGRMHTHPVDVAIQVTSGAVQVVVGDEIQTIRAGHTVLAPPGVPHKLINKLWTSVQMLVTYPDTDLETSYLE